MKNSFEVLNASGELIWAFSTYQDENAAHVLSTFQNESVPGFTDQNERLLMNTIERWCIINEMTIRPALTLTKGGDTKYDDYYRINGEKVFLCFKWMVQARFKRRRSGRVRIHNFEVHSSDREGAIRHAETNFKGATMLELLSLTPCGFGLCYWKDREGFPNLEPSIISRLQMPTDL